jgi:hypothetical protein
MMKCLWCQKHQFKDEHGNESDYHHWCSKYNKSCHSVYESCNELKTELKTGEKIKETKGSGEMKKLTVIELLDAAISHIDKGHDHIVTDLIKQAMRELKSGIPRWETFEQRERRTGE